MGDDSIGGQSNPRVGMLAIVRKRRAVVSEVNPFTGENGVLHLVRLEYKDDYRPQTEEVIWELEPFRRLLEPNELPRSTDPPMPMDDYDALVRASRWSAIMPYLDPKSDGRVHRMPISAPFHGAVQVEDYQMVPLLKALGMPRINLMIADDVGLGKTVEAGLILSELLIRRRIQRVLILTPASLRQQWLEEMWSKFSLPFDLIDRESTQKLKRSIGIDANPWRSCSRIISSYYYLRQPDVMEQFLSACPATEDSPHLPWDLLIVDEVHNLMPAPFGEDSELCKSLRNIAPHFEHRLFLTATPHNGHTRCFSGLLELLDPVRFTRTDELKPAEKDRVRQVVVRRLKREINRRKTPPPFCERTPPEALILRFGRAEKSVLDAFSEFRSKVRSLIASKTKKRRLAGTFAIEILGKRLLSSPITFADSWRRCKLGLREDENVNDGDVIAARKTVVEDTSDDRETERRVSIASTVIGSWMKPIADELAHEIGAIDRALAQLRIDIESDEVIEQNPVEDVRFDSLCRLIDRLLRNQTGTWKQDERLVVFTEYKTTLDYLFRRLGDRYKDSYDRFLRLFGGMVESRSTVHKETLLYSREHVKDLFNNPESKVRVLLATDAASEGLNLQSSARYLLHYDCPWNPSRLEQRNGRLDRHGQARDVSIYHFASDQDADLKFMAYLITKVDQIREDLGATGEIFDEATHRCLIEGENVDSIQHDLEIRLASAKFKSSLDADDRIADSVDNADWIGLESLAQEIDLDPQSQHKTLDAAMSINSDRRQLEPLDASNRCRIINPSLTGWSDTIDETVRRVKNGSDRGPLPSLTFSTEPFMYRIDGRRIFRPRLDTLMIHLGHPLMGKAINTLKRRCFPGQHSVSRWTVKYGPVPSKAEALILLHLEELAVNELRETFHHWIQTHQFPIVGGELGDPLDHAPASSFRKSSQCGNPELIEKAKSLLGDLEADLQKFVRQSKNTLSQRLKDRLEIDRKLAEKEELERYQSRQGEVSSLIAENSLAKLEREIAQLKHDRQQGRLFEIQNMLDEIDRSMEIKKNELERRRSHYEELRDLLSRERKRIINHLLPKRYKLQGEAQVFPVAVEVHFAVDEGRDQ